MSELNKYSRVRFEMMFLREYKQSISIFFIFFNIMNVKETLANYHLLLWLQLQAKNFNFQSQFFTLLSAFQCGALAHVFKTIDEPFFQQMLHEDQGLPQFINSLDHWIIKYLGKRMKVELKNRILLQGFLQDFVMLLLFCKLHSKKKQESISRILLLDEGVQSSLMSSVQYISGNVVGIVYQNDIIIRVQQLENEVYTLKYELKVASANQINLTKTIEELEQELLKKSQQIKRQMTQKSKMFESLQVTSLDEIVAAFQRIQKQNKILSQYIQQLEDSNIQLQKNQHTLKRDIENQSFVIVDLNESINNLQKKINFMRLQQSLAPKLNLEDLYGGRNFGTELSNKENEIELQRKKEEKKAQESENLGKLYGQKALIQQMQELRKYNSQLISKLETAYKTLNSISQQNSQLKERNQHLQRQCKFFRKQISTLKKIQQKMEEDILNGLI